MRYLIYRNLHAKTPDERWSICTTTTGQSRGKVIGHARYVTLRDCTFVVKASRLAAYRAGGGKEPFAWVYGELIEGAPHLAGATAQPVTFCAAPGAPDTFTTRDAAKRPVHRAEWVRFGDYAIAYGQVL